MFSKPIAVLVAQACCSAAFAADLFTITATQSTLAGPVTASVGFKSVRETVDFFEQQNLRAAFPSYTGVEVVNANVGFRGLPINLSYPVAGSSRLDLDIPSLGISRRFVGATRDESNRQLRDFFKNGDVLGRVMKELMKASPVDPIAGNPASLQARMGNAAFESGFRALISQEQGYATPGERTSRASQLTFASAAPATRSDAAPARPASVASTTLGAGVTFTHAGGFSTAGANVPLTQTLPPDPHRPLSFDGSLYYQDTEGAATAGMNVGASYRFRLSEAWSLAPSARYGFTGSVDQGSFGQVIMAALTSAARLVKEERFSLWMGNTVSYSRIPKTSIGGYSSDPKVGILSFTNGLVMSTTRWPSLGSGYWIEYSITDTRNTGAEVYDHRVDDISIRLGRTLATDVPSYLRFGVNYLHATHTRGFGVQVYYTF